MKLDILLCSGSSRMSKTIQFAQKWTGHDDYHLSHVALLVDIDVKMKKRINFVLKQKKIDYRIKVGLNVFESTTMNKWAGKRGVQINPYSDWLANYNGKVFSRPVTAPDACASGLTDCICEYVAPVDLRTASVNMLGLTTKVACRGL